LNVENINLSRTTVASDLTASDFIWCPVIEDLLYHLGINDRESLTPKYEWPRVTYDGSHSRLRQQC